jgi:hypothetical protein
MAAAEQNCEFAAAEPLFSGGLLYPAINTFEGGDVASLRRSTQSNIDIYQGATDYAFRRGH